jgi:SNF2 family DNA or RNA helicase
MLKLADIDTPLLPHQKRVVDRIQTQPGLVVMHGLGSGKTLTSIAAAEKLKADTGVVVPAALKANYQKELDKHVSRPDAKYDISSLQMAARGKVPTGKDLLVVDEAHRTRDALSKTTQGIRSADAGKRLLLTGSALYNHPHDLATLINTAANAPVLPGSKPAFDHRYIGEKAVDPGLLGRLRGIKPGSRPVLQNDRELKTHLDKWVDFHENDRTGFPERKDTTIETPMSKEQNELYAGVLDSAPAWAKYKITRNLPPNKQEARDLNAFANAARQASISPGGFVAGLSPADAAKQSPKIQRAVQSLEEAIAANPDHRAVVYSNYLDSGIDPYSAELTARGIPHGRFTGAVDDEERQRLVSDYNAGKLRALLLSSAGGEGLDLKGTRAVQILEPHWNKEKVEQVIGRGIRYQSHDHLPPDQRTVNVEHYRSVADEPGVLSRLIGRKREGRIDEYMASLGEDKDRLNEQVRELLRRRAEAA